MKTLWSLIFVVQIWCQAVSSISPKTAEVKPDQELRVTCNDGAMKPLDKCVFRVWLENETGELPDTELMDFSRGTESPTLIRRRANNDINFKGTYTGDKLESGQCGVTLSELTVGRYFVGCRVRAQDGEWSYDFMAFVVHSDGDNEGHDSATPFQNQTVAFKNDSQAFVFNAPAPLEECQVFLTEQPSFTLKRGSSPNLTDNKYEAKLIEKSCTVTLREVTLRTSGPIWALYREVGEKGWKAFPPQIINVKAAPSNASLDVLIENATADNLTALCAVLPSRPVAHIRWEVDGKVVRLDNASTIEAWAWPWDLQPITQRRRISVDRVDSHIITCRVFFPDYNSQFKLLSEEIPKSEKTTVSPTTPPPRAPDDKTTAAPDGPDDAGERIWPCVVFGIAASAVVIVLTVLASKHRERIASEWQKFRAGRSSGDAVSGVAAKRDQDEEMALKKTEG